jgi:hypothetical protein
LEQTPLVTVLGTKVAHRALITEGQAMKHAVLVACLAAMLAAGCRREEAAPVLEPMKLGAATPNETMR